MKIDWCRNKITVEVAETKNLIKDERLGDLPVPFGFVNYQWVALKEKLQEGDELWEFRSPSKDWDSLAGREGICIVRDGKVVAYIVTSMS